MKSEKKIILCAYTFISSGQLAGNSCGVLSGSVLPGSSERGALVGNSFRTWASSGIGFAFGTDPYTTGSYRTFGFESLGSLLLLRRRLKRKNARARMIAMPARAPMTIPAIAPPERDDEDDEDPVDDGVDV